MVRFNPLVETKELGRISTPKGKLSIFYALELARNYQMIDSEITRMKFRYLMKTEKKQRALVFGLMEEMGIAGTERFYGGDHLEGVQAFWDKQYPETFRVVAFEAKKGLKPIFKGEVVKKYENKLADLPKTLELDIPAKLYFPHKYNKNANFGIILPHLPPFDDYGPNNMTEEGYGKFAAWYEENKNTEFELGHQLKVYCENDGCVFHGCPRCFRPWTKGVDGELMEEKLMRTEMKMARLRDICKNFTVEEVWASERVEIAMFDIISLYPSVNYDAPYPVGIPKIVIRDEDVLWTVPEDLPYDGLLKVKVVPPKNLLYPLLPAHIDDMLLFPLCGICATRAKKDFVMAKDEKKCEHVEEERALLGTFTSIELRKALELGYKVTHFYRAYHFEEFDSQLFKGGKYDIRLERENMKKNPGLRLIAKLGLNSLWGKFSMRNNLSEHDILKSGEEWAKILQDDRLLPSEPVLQKDGLRVRRG
uniref:DNA-directed DNA polymerase n=1 Tax=Globodera pallida TaxID=36090 RepID=A0A183C9K6_GLOPA